MRTGCRKSCPPLYRFRPLSELIVVWGPPCSGKTTEALSIGGNVIDLDLIAQELGSPVTHDHASGVVSEAIRVREERIAAAIQQGAGVITQTFLTRMEEASYLQAGAQIRVVDPGMDACIARATADGRPSWTYGFIRQWYASDGRSRQSVKGERNMKLQTKFAPLEAEVDQRGKVTGYASKFGIRDQGGDIVVKGAFGDLKRKPKMLFQHDASQVVGVWDKFAEDENGLHVEGRINLGSTLGKDVHSNLEFGAIDGMSIGYRAIDAVKAAGGRELRKVDLWEVSFVTFPMLPDAMVQSIKAMTDPDPIEVKRFVEGLLREADFSADEAKAAAAAVARVRAEREVSTGQEERLSILDIRNALRGL